MDWLEKHSGLLGQACSAIGRREFYTPYPEFHKAYDEALEKSGLAAFEAQWGNKFSGLLEEQASGWTGEEQSSYTSESLGVSYPIFEKDFLVQNAQEARLAWKEFGVGKRAGLLVEALDRLKARFFEMAHATMHTTGQSFMMAFQASGPHASDRALEATAMGYLEQTRFPEQVSWRKPMGKSEIHLNKRFRPVPKGIGLVIGCSTFPVWNTVPGMFASLVTGNPVIVKPHPRSVWPIAIVIAELQKLFSESGLNPHIVQLAMDTTEAPLARELALDPAIRLIDYTGGTELGNYLETLTDKVVFTEKSGVNQVLLDSVEDLDAVLQNLAFSVTLYSGQMCTAPQNIYIPATGVQTSAGPVSFDEVVNRFKNAVDNVVNHPKMGAGTVAALQNEQTLFRVQRSTSLGGKMIREPRGVENPDFEKALTCSPAIIQVEASEKEKYSEELFGPIVMIIKTRDLDESIEIARDLAQQRGAITCAAYTTDLEKEEAICLAMEEAFVGVSINLTGYIWVNQAAAFSDFHVSGGNPAGTASFTDPAFLSRRFVWLGHRKPAGS